MYSEDVNLIKAKIKIILPKLLLLAILSSILYLVVDLLEFLFYEGASSALSYLKSCANIKVILALLIFNDPISGYHLWYIYAYLYVLIIYLYGISLILKYRKFFTALSFILLAVFVVFDTYLKPHFSNVTIFGANIFAYKELVRNAYFFGFPFFTIGFFLGSKTLLKKCENKSLLLAVAVLGSFGISLLESTFIEKFEYMSVGIILMSISVFLFLLTQKNILSNTPIPRLGRQYTLYVYLVHVVVGKSMVILVEHTTLFSGFTYAYGFIQPLVVFILSLLLSIGYVQLKNKLFKRPHPGNTTP